MLTQKASTISALKNKLVHILNELSSFMLETDKLKFGATKLISSECFRLFSHEKAIDNILHLWYYRLN